MPDFKLTLCDFSSANGEWACRVCGRVVRVAVRPTAVCADSRSRLAEIAASSQPNAAIIAPETQPAGGSPALASEADPVSWLQKARNFATATAKHIAAGMPTASDEEILQRWTICQGCEFLKNDACSKCGCPVARDKKFVSKLAWADQSCPVGKWGPASA